MIDYNCYLGYWPFYKLKNNSFEDLKKSHKENNIEYGYVSSLQSIFYNDFYESEKDLYETIKGSNYKHVVTVNPNLPACTLTLKRCIEEFDVSGIRLVSGYHGYKLTDRVLKPITEIAKEHNLILFVTLRLYHDCFYDYINPIKIDGNDVKKLIKENPGMKIIVNYAEFSEMLKFKDQIVDNPYVAADVSAFTGNQFSVDNDITQNLVFGSAFPLTSVKTIKLLVDNYPAVKFKNM